LLADGWWFSPGTPASFTIKTGRHDIAEILGATNNTNEKKSEWSDMSSWSSTKRTSSSLSTFH
jgi:hypothetical protein